jgi:hypothetical protein
MTTHSCSTIPAFSHHVTITQISLIYYTPPAILIISIVLPVLWTRKFCFMNDHTNTYVREECNHLDKTSQSVANCKPSQFYEAISWRVGELNNFIAQYFCRTNKNGLKPSDCFRSLQSECCAFYNYFLNYEIIYIAISIAVSTSAVTSYRRYYIYLVSNEKLWGTWELEKMNPNTAMCTSGPRRNYWALTLRRPHGTLWCWKWGKRAWNSSALFWNPGRPFSVSLRRLWAP